MLPSASNLTKYTPDGTGLYDSFLPSQFAVRIPVSSVSLTKVFTSSPNMLKTPTITWVLWGMEYFILVSGLKGLG